MASYLEKIEEAAKKFMENSKPAHDFDHVKRVMRLVERIGRAENGDLEILRAAALLHDIGRIEEEKTGECHAEKGALLARKILMDCGFPESKIEAVLHCIESHRFRGNLKPRSLEAKILYDADKLDAIGAIGIARAYSFGGERGQKLYTNSTKVNKFELKKQIDLEHTPVVEFAIKLGKIKEHLYTKTAREIARGRHRFMVKFYERLQKEVEGEL